MAEIKNLVIINQTHWDREWYGSYESFRYRLRDGIRKIVEKLNQNEIDHFFFDGQTILIDDYKEIVSKEEFNDLIKLLQANKIQCGPWYLLADEFLVSQELLIKNLEIGYSIAKKYDLTTTKLGYLPDTFGHISQMPQVLNNFNIEHALIWRGANTSYYENIWQGANGDYLKTIELTLFEGYFQTYLQSENYIEKVDDFIKRSAPSLTGDTLFLLNGADHTISIEYIKEKIIKLQEAFPNINVSEGNINDIINKVDFSKTKVNLKGALRDNTKIFLLPGVLSSRTYLKTKNQTCEDIVTYIMEPLSLIDSNAKDNHQFKEYVYKRLLKNHPHDSICGCSIDSVHFEMIGRYNRVYDAVREYQTNILNELYPFSYRSDNLDNESIYVFNTLPYSSKRCIDFKIITVFEEGAELVLEDINGNTIDHQVLNEVYEEMFFHNVFKEPAYALKRVYYVRVIIDFKGVELKRIKIRKATTKIRLIEDSTINNKSISNEFYEITYNDTSLVIKDKISNKYYDNINLFKSSLDAGDTYNYSPPLNDKQSVASISNVVLKNTGAISNSLEVNYTLELPKSLNEDRCSYNKELSIIKITSLVTLIKNDRKIYFNTNLNNTAKDHRLQVLFKVYKAEFSYSDSAFDIASHKTLRNINFKAEHNKEVIDGMNATQSSVLVNEMQYMHLGLNEYGIIEYNNQDYLASTILRCVGWLSRRDLQTRGNGAGPSYETSEAQCLGDHSFKYALCFNQSKLDLSISQQWRIPLAYMQSYVDKKELAWFRKTDDDIIFSYLEQIDNKLIIRLFNSSNKKTSTTLSFDIPVIKILQTKINKDPIKTIPLNQVLNLTLKPKEIMQLSIEIESYEGM